jgi:Mn2+/Fe2+ NRAMP family transporter
MDGRPVKIWTTVSLAAGLLVVLIFKAAPVELIRFAQGLAVIAFPLLGFLVMSVAGDRKVMGTYVNKPWMQVAAIIGYIAILAIVINYLRQIASAL